MRSILLFMLCACIVAAFAACGGAPEDAEEPAVETELPAVTETIAPTEAETEPETETIPETEPETEVPTEVETTAPVQDGSWANGVWKPGDDDEMDVFTPQGKGHLLREMDTARYDEYMRFENGEILLTEKSVSAYGELTEITRDEDIDNFRIYAYVALLEDGLEGTPVYYVLDKDGKLYVLYVLNYSYEATPDSLILGEGLEDNERMAVEIIDSEHVNLTVETLGEPHTVTLVKIPHLDAVINYLN